jgi:hypothetical protein
MMRRPLTLAVLACAAALAGCDNSNPAEPDALPTRVISELYLLPFEGTLFTIGLPDKLPLEVRALDQWGQDMDWTRSITFISNAPAVAVVDERGVVTAVAAGIAKISATVTIGGVTRSASMTASVVEPPVLPVSGTYDVEALVSCCLTNAAGESLNYTGVLTFPGQDGTVGPVGTFAGWQLRTPAGEALGQPLSGTILLAFWSGRPYLKLLFSDDPVSMRGHFVFLTIAESPESDTSYPSLQGEWWEDDGWGVGGTYTATRRVQ